MITRRTSHEKEADYTSRTKLIVQRTDAIVSCYESRHRDTYTLDESSDRCGILLSRGSFRNTPSKQQNWELSNRTERQRRSAGARGEEEFSTRARLLITGTAARRVGEGPENIGREKRTRREREKKREEKGEIKNRSSFSIISNEGSFRSGIRGVQPWIKGRTQFF